MKTDNRPVLIASMVIVTLTAGSCIPLPIPYRSHQLTVTGVVRDADSKPIEGCAVELHSFGEVRKAATAADGTFAVTSDGKQQYILWFPLVPVHTRDFIPGAVTVACPGRKHFRKEVEGGSYHVGPPSDGAVELGDVIVDK